MAVFTGVPTWFRGCCQAARERASVAPGCRLDYTHPAIQLAKTLWRLSPMDLSDKEWREELDKLDDAAIAKRDDAFVDNWLSDHFPKCMALIPARRRTRFVAAFVDTLELEWGHRDE